MDSDSQSKDDGKDDKGEGKGERESQHTVDCGSNDTWIVNQVRLKAQL
jgi:hypothetical protein